MFSNEFYKADKKRYGGGHVWGLRFLFFLRLAQTSNNLLIKRLSTIICRHYYRKKYGLEIPVSTKIGKWLYIGHAFNITINKDAVIGEYCNIHRGIVIGQENRGKRKGTPRIGNKVWIGINVAIVGNITIGDDVLIAPNSYVNCDVPSHSIVYGNPCIIKYRGNATEEYINIK